MVKCKTCGSIAKRAEGWEKHGTDVWKKALPEALKSLVQVDSDEPSTDCELRCPDCDARFRYKETHDSVLGAETEYEIERI